LNLTTNPAFHRLELLTGKQGLEALGKSRVIIFGIGGVGSWCAEALVRSGIGSLTIVDSDVVCVTNINRQVQATSKTVGKSKTAELGKRLREIQPCAAIVEIHKVFNKTTADDFDLGSFDYIIDCIDSLSSKVELIIRAFASGAKVFTSLGASCKLDPSQIRVGSLWDSYNCPLGKFVRKRLRRRGFSGEVSCVFSPEEMALESGTSICGTGQCMCPKFAIDDEESLVEAHEWCSSKKQINGSVVHITGIFGFTLAGLVVQDIVQKARAAVKT
jgi:tRNA A37 threonylcarbamoyladenosine dehydratase